MQRYIKLLLTVINHIEQSVLPCKYDEPKGEVTVDVKFHIAELPNDMKMVTFLSGELGDSAQ